MPKMAAFEFRQAPGRSEEIYEDIFVGEPR